MSKRGDRTDHCERNPKAGNDLVTQTINWPTPSSADAKGRSYQYDRHDKNKPRDGLIRVAEKFSHPVQVMSVDGIELSPTVNSITERRRLNPEFVEWLMGWPIGWTSTDAIACDAPAMASWRRRLRRHLLNLFDEPLVRFRSKELINSEGAA